MSDWTGDKPVRVPQGRGDRAVQGLPVDQERVKEGSVWGEMPLVALWGSFYFTKCKGPLQKVTRN